MENKIEKIIEHGNSVHQKHEQIRQEILADEILLPKELRDELNKLKEQFNQQKIDDDKYIEDNKHRKIVGYDERYMPIYEDEK
jgi:hypothetical protein